MCLQRVQLRNFHRTGDNLGSKFMTVYDLNSVVCLAEEGAGLKNQSPPVNVDVRHCSLLSHNCNN